jgi:hypothetical protein
MDIASRARRKYAIVKDTIFRKKLLKNPKSPENQRGTCQDVWT